MDRRAFLAAAGTVFLPRAAGARLRPRVIVVGAGLAGLAAAWELVQGGLAVIVLEARDAPGGRVRTVRAPFADGLYAEAGAVLVPDTHSRVRRLAEQLHLTLVAAAPLPAGELYYVRGRRVVVGAGAAESWPLDLTVEERRLGLPGMWQRYVASALDDIGDPAAPGWPPPTLAPYDAMTMAEFLRVRGASRDAAALLALGYLDLGGDGAESYSALSMLRDLALRRGTRRSWAIAGGNDQLPVAMAARLGARVCYGTPVIRIEPGAHAAAVVTRPDGESESQRWVADHVICTAPPPVLARVDVAPAFSPARRAAIAAIAATSVTRVLFQTRTRFWHAQHLPGSAVSDLPIKWVWDATAAQPGVRGILDVHLGGSDARRLAALPHSRLERVVAHLERVYPGAGAQVEAAVALDWDAEPWARGAYAWFRPGQLTSLMRSLAAPEGCVHLAGEHLSSASGWMEGALESGLRAARDVLASFRS
jgi:monoamine oxidase